MAKRGGRIGSLDVWRDLAATTDEQGTSTFKEARVVDLALIDPDPNQPRKTFHADSLAELADSIRAHGVLQPILLRPHGERFIITVGQRRYEAAKQAGLTQIPAVIRETSEQQALEQALIENIQREDINPIEEAASYRQLMDEHGYSIRDMAARMHKSVGYIHGRLDLLRHTDVTDAVRTGEISVSIARELVKVEDEALRQALKARVVAGELNHKELKRQIQRHTTGTAAPAPPDMLAMTRRWGRLQRDFQAIEAESLAAEERAQARTALEALQQEVAALLKRL